MSTTYAPEKPRERLDSSAEQGRGGSWAWGRRMLAHVTELESQVKLMRVRAEGHGDVSGVPGLAHDACHLLDAARRAIRDQRSSRRFWTLGATVDEVCSSISAAAAIVLRYAPPEDVRGMLPDCLANVQQHLLRTDPRRIALEELVQRDKGREKRDELSEADRGVIVGATRAASSEWEREQARARSFRDLLCMATSVLFVLAITVAIVGSRYDTLLPLCFNPVEDDRVVCPTRSGPYVDENLALDPAGDDVNDAFADNASPLDYALVAGVGLLAAAVAAATTLRRIRGTSTPYGIPVALAVFKLPTGALTAVLGLVLMRGQFVPGLSALDSSAQIVAWAAVFGYSQQLFTRLVDERGQAVLNGVGSAETTDSSRHKTPQA